MTGPGAATVAPYEQVVKNRNDLIAAMQTDAAAIVIAEREVPLGDLLRHLAGAWPESDSMISGRAVAGLLWSGRMVLGPDQEITMAKPANDRSGESL